MPLFSTLGLREGGACTPDRRFAVTHERFRLRPECFCHRFGRLLALRIEGVAIDVRSYPDRRVGSRIGSRDLPRSSYSTTATALACYFLSGCRDLNPGPLDPQRNRTGIRVSIRVHRENLTRCLCPLTSVRVQSGLSAWLHKWLHTKVVWVPRRQLCIRGKEGQAREGEPKTGRGRPAHRGRSDGQGSEGRAGRPRGATRNRPGTGKGERPERTDGGKTRRPQPASRGAQGEGGVTTRRMVTCTQKKPSIR